MGNDRAIFTMAKAICDSITDMVPTLPFDRTYQGRIRQVLSGNRYSVQIGGASYAAYNSTGISFAVNEKVWVLAPQNSFNDLLISGRRV